MPAAPPPLPLDRPATARDLAALYTVLADISSGLRALGAVGRDQVDALNQLRMVISDRTALERAPRPKLGSLHDVVEELTGVQGTPTTPPLTRWAEKKLLRWVLRAIAFASTAAAGFAANEFFHHVTNH